MRHGYLLIETTAAFPDLVRLRGAESLPVEPGTDLRYVACFNDLDAALMHFHEGVKRRLVDLDNRLYQVPVTRAIAVAEAIELSHRRVFTDPELVGSPAIEIEVERLRRRHRHRDRALDIVGLVAVLALLLTALLV